MMDGQRVRNQGEAGDDRIDLAMVAGRLWQGKRDILVCAAAFLLLGILYLQVATKYYTATIVLVPTQGEARSGLSQFSGLASMAGIDLSGLGHNAEPFTYYPDALKSSAVAEDLARTSPDIMHRLFKDQWDEQTQHWVAPHGVLHTVASFIKQVLSGEKPEWQPPDPVELQSVIATRVYAVSDIKNPVLTVTFRDPDPVFATHFLTQINQSTDRVLRRMTLDRASQYAAYLEKKLPTVQLSDLRQVLVQSLSMQETLIMMGSSNAPFAAQTLGPPVSSLRPTNPSAALVLILSIFFGAMLGAAAAYFDISPLGGIKNLYGIAIGPFGGGSLVSRK